MRRSTIQHYLDHGHTLEEVSHIAADKNLSTCAYNCVTHMAGHGRSDFVREARRKLTQWLERDPVGFCDRLVSQMTNITAYHSDAEFALRANINSDVNWRVICPAMFTFGWSIYDYTKCSERLGWAPWHLTYSVNEGTCSRDWDRVYRAGCNISVVFDSVWNPWRLGQTFGYLPAVFTDAFGREWPVVDGDANDLRFLDPVGVCVGLRHKGGPDQKRHQCCTEFVVDAGTDEVGHIHPADAPAGYYILENCYA